MAALWIRPVFLHYNNCTLELMYDRAYVLHYFTRLYAKQLISLYLGTCANKVQVNYFLSPGYNAPLSNCKSSFCLPSHNVCSIFWYPRSTSLTADILTEYCAIFGGSWLIDKDPMWNSSKYHWEYPLLLGTFSLCNLDNLVLYFCEVSNLALMLKEKMLFEHTKGCCNQTSRHLYFVIPPISQV